MIPFTVILAIVLVILFGLRRRLRQLKTSTEDRRQLPNEDQPYIQSKAELEAGGKRRCELEAKERVHELGIDNEIPEMSAHAMPEHRSQEARAKTAQSAT